MSRPNPGKLAAVMVVLIVLSALPVLLRGGLYITDFEGDALHLADIGLRMADGERPHLDFMTPIGSLAFWPVVLGLRAGMGLGHAFVFGQTLFALVAGAAVWWAAVSRLPARLAYLFAIVCVILLTSLTHGSKGASIAISMHYNRWAWVLSFAAVVIAVLPPAGRGRPALDGSLLAALVAALAFIKITYAAAFAPALILILAARGDWGRLGAALVAGAVLAAVLAALLGPDAILAYVDDLRTVAGADIRNQPGLALHDIVVSPGYFVGTLTAIAGMALIRRAGSTSEGFAILILIPAWIYVTWQNFGNDPAWLILLAILFLALRPPRRTDLPAENDPSVGVGLAAFAALILAFPFLQSQALGGVRLLTLDTEHYVPMVDGRKRLADVFVRDEPSYTVRAQVNQMVEGAPYAAYADRIPDYEPDTFLGEIMPPCQSISGFQTLQPVLGAEAAAVAERVLVADVITSHWLFGGILPLKGGAPWNYGTLAGLENAEAVLVPICPIDVRVRRAVLKRLEDSGKTVELASRTERSLIYTIR